MVVVYLSNSILPSREANSIQVMKMCSAFSRLGVEVHLVAKSFESTKVQETDVFRYYGVKQAFRIHLIRARNIKGSGIVCLPATKKILSKLKRNAALIYGRDVYGLTLASVMGFRVIYEAHSLPVNPLVLLLEKYLSSYKRLVKVVVISAALKKAYVKKVPGFKCVQVLHDAADAPDARPAREYCWPCKTDRLQVGYIGNLYKGRGIEIIIECAKALKQYDFHIIGGAERDIAFYKNTGSANIYYHGFIPPSEINQAVTKCDVLLMPYQRAVSVARRDVDTSKFMSPLKMFEYMSFKKPIISSDLPVIREVLNENNSILLPPEDVRAWIKAIMSLDNPNDRTRLASRAFNDFLKYFTWDSRAIQALKDCQL